MEEEITITTRELFLPLVHSLRLARLVVYVPMETQSSIRRPHMLPMSERFLFCTCKVAVSQPRIGEK